MAQPPGGQISAGDLFGYIQLAGVERPGLCLSASPSVAQGQLGLTGVIGRNFSYTAAMKVAYMEKSDEEREHCPGNGFIHHRDEAVNYGDDVREVLFASQVAARW
jgi:hypothetical protein